MRVLDPPSTEVGSVSRMCFQVLLGGAYSRKQAYTQMSRAKGHNPPLHAGFPEFVIPFPNLLTSFTGAPCTDRPLVSLLTDIHEPRVDDRLFHRVTYPPRFPRYMTALIPKLLPFVEDRAGSKGTVRTVRHDGHFGLLYVSVRDEMALVIKLVVRLYSVFPIIARANQGGMSANLLEALFVELRPIPYAPVQKAHVDNVETFSNFFEECPF